MIKDLISFYDLKNTQHDELHWRVQECTSNSILFYRYNPKSHDSKRLFRERMKDVYEKKSLVLLLPESPVELLPDGLDYRIVESSDWTSLQRQLCDKYYPMPKGSSFIGITGTNGKTSTAFFLAQLLGQKKISTLVLGTMGVREANFKVIQDEKLTTLPLIELRKIFHRYGGRYSVFVMELSSHALDQQRMPEVCLTSAGWTSFSQDHLDYHGTMEKYFEAKLKITSLLIPGGTLHVPSTETLLISSLEDTGLGILQKVEVLKKQQMPPQLTNEVARKNLSLALALAKTICNENDFALEGLVAIPGRMQTIQHGQMTSIVDFAHTADALENLLQQVKRSYPEKEILLVFGCGGDRDKGKRPAMGRVAEAYAETIILTNDNPRFERPEHIIRQILSGIENHQKVKTIFSRGEAIELALQNAHEGNIIVVAGKGDETQIDLGDRSVPFHDASFIQNFWKQHAQQT